MKDLKEKVRTLCLQQDPSNALILLTLEELSRTARKVSHDEADTFDTFEELARQANRHQGKLDVPSLCLSVLGGKAADAITKAISKCLKERSSESKSEPRNVESVGAPKREDSPLHNLYPQSSPYQMSFMYPMPQPFLQPPYFGNSQTGYSGYRNRPRQPGFRPRGAAACLFCNSTTHLIKDCQKMKAAKGK